jgi:hypothetical protein
MNHGFIDPWASIPRFIGRLCTIAMSKAQKGNKEKKKPKADKNQPKTHVSAYKAAQEQGKPSVNPFARKT